MVTLTNEDNMRQKMKLIDLINNINNYDERDLLYLPKNYSILNPESECVIISEENFDEEIDNFCYALGLYSVIDILENLKDQSAEVSLRQKIEALEFYIKNDAFISITSARHKHDASF